MRHLFYWLKLGFISFGGPAGQISMMHQELVEKRRWISEKRFLHALNYTMVLPGPEAQLLATYIGWLMHGTLGGIIAGFLFVLPSLFILNLAMFFAYHVLWPNGFGENYEFVSTIEWPAVFICTFSFIALFRFKMGIMTLIAITAGIGLMLSFFI